MGEERKRLLGIWLALMMLLALTCGSAFLKLGPWNGVVNLGIATIKAGLVANYFMHLGKAHGVIRLCAAIAFFLLALMFGLSGGDYATRTLYPVPWEAPPASRVG